jgi:uncharacterized protein
MDRAVVALSGGVDSGLVLALARDEVPGGVLAVTSCSESVPPSEVEEARALARALGAEHLVIRTEELSDPAYRANPVDRCWHCKDELYGKLTALARERGFGCVLDGTNADDARDVRPGMRAAREHGVRSPLLEAGIGKDEVRALARGRGLAVWDKPAAPCLSSRVPHGTEITAALLARIDAAEQALRALGFREVRVRHHGELGRVELPEADLARAAAPPLRDAVLRAVTDVGWSLAVLDLQGFRSGAFAALERRRLAAAAAGGS